MDKNNDENSIFIKNANYNVQPNGTILYHLDTDPYLDFSKYNNNTRFFQLPFLIVGGVYSPVDWTAIKLPKWVTEHVLISNLDHCPVCLKEIVTDQVEMKHCFNDLCPARVKNHVTNFLNAVGVQLEGDDFNIVLGLPEYIIHPAQLFTLEWEHVSGVTKKSYNSFMRKINAIKGNFTMSQFLTSLNLSISPEAVVRSINPDNLNRNFKNVTTMFDWMNSIQEKLASGMYAYHAEDIMSYQLYNLLYLYFTHESNYSYATLYDTQAVFKK